MSLEKTAIYVVMERHKNLHDYIIENPELEPDRKTQLGISLCSTLIELYRLDPPRPFGHLSPKNVLVTDQKKNQVKITDVTETPLRHYTSKFKRQDFRNVYQRPEVLLESINSEDSTEKEDVYSFGVILWFIFTGTPPFKESVSAARTLFNE